MEYRSFGQTEMQVSPIGFGCWEMGGGYGSIEEGEVIAAIHRAIDLGINCFDTAEAYGMGRSERLLAKALGARRKDVIVVTKFGINYKNDRPKGRDSRPSMVHAAIERSLKALDTDYVDVYIVHWPDRATPFDETLQALEEVVQQGKVRYVGLSNFTPDEIKRCMKSRRVDVLQYGCNLFDRRMAKWIFPYAHEHGIGVMTYGSLAYGLLSGAFTEETTFEEEDWRRRGGSNMSLKLFAPEVFKRNVRVVNELKAIAEGLGKKLSHLALNWVLSNPAVSVSLVGARRAAEVEDNMGAIGWKLTDDVKAEIDRVFAEYEIDAAPNKWTESID
ncbi:MAG: aldo/keto reductase [Candidatus Poribacteria bacterium]|nr:aldo/keto reductase [Candidatus Poribacteria bacterium]